MSRRMFGQQTKRRQFVRLLIDFFSNHFLEMIAGLSFMFHDRCQHECIDIWLQFSFGYAPETTLGITPRNNNINYSLYDTTLCLIKALTTITSTKILSAKLISKFQSWIRERRKSQRELSNMKSCSNEKKTCDKKMSESISLSLDYTAFSRICLSKLIRPWQT